jgi:predicted lipid-binding transport protein (Tim44 family)
MFSGPYVDILIFAILAVFLIFRLRSVLGRRDGFDEKPQDRDSTAGFQKREPISDDQNLSSGEGVEAIVKADPYFSQQSFMQGAENAYRMILDNFARGDMDQLKPLLGYDMASSFSDAIRDRRKAGEELSITLVEISRVDLLRAWVSEGVASIAVEYHSTQIRVLRDEAGNILDGESEEPETFVDQWTFERDVTTDNPNWLLTETQASQS